MKSSDSLAVSSFRSTLPRSTRASRRRIWCRPWYVHELFVNSKNANSNAVLQVLPAAVKSVEDKGYVLDLGVPDISAFLTFDQVTKSAKVQQTLSVGQLVSVKVDQVAANGRTVSLSLAADNDAVGYPQFRRDKPRCSIS